MDIITVNEEQQQLGRAKNAVMFFLERKLIVPSIYIDALWDSHGVDVLAIERDGVGDVHAALLFARRYYEDGKLDTVQEANDTVAILLRFASLPAQYKYVVAVDVRNGQACPRPDPPPQILERFFSPDGLGRIGLLSVGLSDNNNPDVTLVIKPERFRAKIAKLADEYVQQHEADWEIRA